MIVALNVDNELEITEADDFSSLSFYASGDQQLRDTAAVIFEGQHHAWIAMAALHNWPGGSSLPRWHTEIENIAKFAQSRGWFDHANARIRAHITT